MFVQGYLVSSTIDYLSQAMGPLSYTWVLAIIGWLGPTLVMVYSHIIINNHHRSENIFPSPSPSPRSLTISGTTMCPCLNSAPRKRRSRTLFSHSLRKEKRSVSKVSVQLSVPMT